MEIQTKAGDQRQKSFKIIDFEDKYQPSFAALNYAWIEKHFTVEQMDRDSLDHPREKIYKNGGHILLAQSDEEIIGTCALIKIENGYFELAKMAVSEKHRGKGIGYALGNATLQKAKELGATKVYLESNDVLAPALKLYEKLGFKHIEHKETPYCRCNVQMEILF